MLVIISDLHISDGTCGKPISPDSFRLFSERLKELAFHASWRADGRYRPIETLDILLLGDVLELENSTGWLELASGAPSPIRPWSDYHTPEYAATVARITRKILQVNSATINIFHDLTAGRQLTLTPADRRGRPARFSLVRAPVRVNLHYMIGNHDWYYHLPGPGFDALRQELVQAFGLSNPASIFPHELKEAPHLRDLLDSHGVYAQHGDLFDPLCYSAEKGRDAASLGDMLAIEILNRFPLEAERQMSGDLPVDFIQSLYELVNVRPPLAAPLWISSQLRQNNVRPAAQKKLKKIWDDLGRELLAQPYIKEMNRRFKYDLVDALRVALRISEGLSFRTIDELVVWIRKRFSSGESTFAKHALKEDAFLNRTAQFIVYGHTHHYEVVPLDSTPTVPYPSNQMYMNSGTWHTFYDLAVNKPKEQKFVPYQVLSYLTFYRDDERGGRRFETWSGTFSE
jgi:hypothetical protein